MESYEALIHEMSELIDIPLSMGDRGQVVLEVDGVLTVHIENMIPSKQVRIATLLYTLPPDAVRERVLTSALRANGLPSPRYGTFAFSSKRSALVLFEHILIDETNGELLCDFLEQFMTKAKIWLEALSSGRTEPPEFYNAHPGQGGAGGLFGL